MALNQGSPRPPVVRVALLVKKSCSPLRWSPGRRRLHRFEVLGVVSDPSSADREVRDIRTRGSPALTVNPKQLLGNTMELTSTLDWIVDMYPTATENVATSVGELGTVAGIQLVAVFQLLVLASIFQVALPAWLS